METILDEDAVGSAVVSLSAEGLKAIKKTTFYDKSVTIRQVILSLVTISVTKLTKHGTTKRLSYGAIERFLGCDIKKPTRYDNAHTILWLVGLVNENQYIPRKYIDIPSGHDYDSETVKNERSEAFFNEFDTFKNDVRDAIRHAQKEVIFYAMNFYILLPDVALILKELLLKDEQQISIRILLLNPFNDELLRLMADGTKYDINDLRSEGIFAVEKIRGLLNTNQNVVLSDRFSVQWTNQIIFGRIFAIDPDEDYGKIFITPYFHGVSPVELPSYVYHSGEHAAIVYVRELRRLLKDRSNCDYDFVCEQLVD